MPEPVSVYIGYHHRENLNGNDRPKQTVTNDEYRPDSRLKTALL